MKTMLANAKEIEFDAVSPKNFYLFLYDEVLMKYKEMFEYCSRLDVSKEIVAPGRRDYDELNELLLQIHEKYNIDMNVNYAQLYLWQKCFLEKTNDEAILAASYLVKFCVMADCILDSTRFSEKQKKYVCKKSNLLLRQTDSKGEFPELDRLLSGFLNYMHMQKDDVFFSKEILKKTLRKAFQSEIYMYKSKIDFSEDLKGKNLSLLVDKSIEFEKVAFIVSLYGNNNETSVLAAELLGKVFWLVDDLCDFIDDIKTGRKNSLLIYCADKETFGSFEERLANVFKNMNRAAKELESTLRKLRNYVDEPFFCFLAVHIWNWFEPVRVAVQSNER